jgi:hypothetical protein
MRRFGTWLRSWLATIRGDPRRTGSTHGAVFRHIEIAYRRRIELGECPDLDAISVARGAGERELLPGEFGGAAAIVIELTPSRVVKGMRFGYSPGTSFQRMRDGYTQMLGPPTSAAPTSATWADRDTVFELREDPGPPAVVSSRLLDRTLGCPPG